MADKKHRILYVDDDQDFLDAMRVMLEAAGYEMTEASSAEDGLRLFKRDRPDLVIVDLMMEEVDSGTSFVKELRLVGGDIPILMVSSVGDNLSMTADYAELGLDGLFQKPVDARTLTTLLEAKLGAKK